MINGKRRVVYQAFSSAGLVLVLLSGCAPPAGRAAPVPARVRESVGYLTATYHVSAADAMRRLRLATAQDGLVRRLSSALPGEYAGVRLDQRNGGVLVVAATRPGHARQVVRGLAHRDEIRVVPAAYSLRDLTRVRDRVVARTGAYAQVNEVTNRVELWTAHPARDASAPAALGPDRGAVVVRTVPTTIPTACEVYKCDPPMRAGISVGIGNKKNRILDYCTSAFNVEDTDGRIYTTTAGHCFTLLEGEGKKPATIVNPPDDVMIGDIKNSKSTYKYSATPLLDYAFARVKNKDHWFPSGHSKNALYFKCSTQPQPKTCETKYEELTYPIKAIEPYGSMAVGDVVCMAGASTYKNWVAPGTRCGEITALSNGGIRTNICAKKGDSGSPLFDQPTNKAYGIESQVGSASTGPCLPADQQETFYTPLSEALTAARTDTGRTYKLITG